MRRNLKWVILAILLLPLVVAAVVLLVDSGGSELSLGLGKKVGLVRIDDAIFSSRFQAEQLRSFREDESIAGVLVEVNSPGGAIVPSQELYRELMRYRRHGKPLVVSMGSVAASGAYYLASAADRIFANPGTITGGIGVFIRVSRVDGLLEKLGVEITTLKAGKYKDIGNPHREMTPKERRLLQGMLDDFHNQFVQDVCEGRRGLDCDSVRALADGRVFTGRQAVELGLIDTLGTSQDALAYLRNSVGVGKNAGVVEKERRRPLLERLLPETFTNSAGFITTLLYPSGIYYLYDISQ